MPKKIKEAVYFAGTGIEAFRFCGTDQSFPLHFHEQYVIGLVENGNRTFCCGREIRVIGPGDLLLLHPRDPHGCRGDGQKLDYRGLSIPPKAMYALVGPCSGGPQFSVRVLQNPELAERFVQLTQHMFDSEPSMDADRMAAFLRCLPTKPPENEMPGESGGDAATAAVRAYIHAHFDAPLSLDHLSELGGMSKSSLLRAFSQETGLTPHAYLANIRVEHARHLLEQGASPADVAICTGFFDQSHLTNRFRTLLGFTPGAYRRAHCHAARE